MGSDWCGAGQIITMYPRVAFSFSIVNDPRFGVMDGNVRLIARDVQSAVSVFACSTSASKSTFPAATRIVFDGEYRWEKYSRICSWVKALTESLVPSTRKLSG